MVNQHSTDFTLRTPHTDTYAEPATTTFNTAVVAAAVGCNDAKRQHLPVLDRQSSSP